MWEERTESAGPTSGTATWSRRDVRWWVSEAQPAILTRVGYNPYRKFRARPGDYAMVVSAIVIAVALVVWGFS